MKFDLRSFFISISILFLSFMIGLYGARFIYYYKSENKQKSTNYNIYEYYIEKESIAKNNLIEENKNYYFYKNNQNNYLYYSGLLYRILYINENFLYVITDESITNLKYGENESYNTSNVKKWLEEVYLKNINDKYLKNKEVSLLDIETFNKIGKEKSNILNNDFWALKDNKALVITEDGKITKTNNYSDFLSVRPVIKLDSNSIIVSGTGTKTNPIIIEKRTKKTLNDLYVGEYINYKNNKYRIIEKNNDYVKVLSLNKLKEQKIFSNYTNDYNLKYKNNLATYLNKTYIKNFNEKDLVKINYYIGEYNLDYEETLKEKVNTYIGLLKIGDYFINNIKNSYTLTKNKNGIYMINEKGLLYIEDIDKKLDVYPVLAFNKNKNIISGNGLINNPYVVGE